MIKATKPVNTVTCQVILVQSNTLMIKNNLNCRLSNITDKEKE